VPSGAGVIEGKSAQFTKKPSLVATSSGATHASLSSREKRSSCPPDAAGSSQLMYTMSPKEDRNGSPLPSPAGEGISWSAT
jgi:hypothetical protein